MQVVNYLIKKLSENVGPIEHRFIAGGSMKIAHSPSNDCSCTYPLTVVFSNQKKPVEKLLLAANSVLKTVPYYIKKVEFDVENLDDSIYNLYLIIDISENLQLISACCEDDALFIVDDKPQKLKPIQIIEEGADLHEVRHAR